MIRFMTATALLICFATTNAPISHAVDEDNEQKLLELAESSIGQIVNLQQRIGVRTRLALAFHRAGKASVAEQTLVNCLTEIAASDIEETIKESEFANIAVAQAQIGNWDSALRTMGKIKNAAPGWGMLADAALEAGDIPHAIEMNKLIRDPFLADVCSGQIASTLAQQGKLEEALRQIGEIKNGDLKSVGYVLICQALWESQKFDDVDRIEKLLEKPEMKAKVLYETTLAAVAAGDRARADRTGERFAQLTKTLDEKTFIRHFALIKAHQGESDEAIALAKTIKETNSQLDALAEVAIVLAKRGEGREAVRLLPAIEKSNRTDEVRREIAIGFTIEGKMEDAVTIAETIATEYTRGKTWRQIAMIRSKTNRSEAQQFLTKSLIAAQRLDKQGGAKVEALREVAEAQAELGGIDSARQTFNLALKAIDQYDDEGMKAGLVSDVATAFAKVIGVREICDWAASQSSPWVAAWALISAAEGLVDAK